jgi:RNA polymerase sigma-54 factor
VKPTLQLRLGQSLTLTPQLRQAIRLLQLSSMELETEINLALESNPLLERPEDRDPAEDPAAEAEPAVDDTVEIEVLEPAGGEDASYETLVEDWEIGGGGGNGSSSGSTDRGDDDPMEATDAVTEDLHDHLLWQLYLTTMSDRDRAIAGAIIEAVNDDGYLEESPEALAESLLPELEAEIDEIEAVRHLLQRFDPLGVASRTLSECLTVQLLALEPDTPGRALSLRLAASELENLARLGADRLAKQMGESCQAMNEAVELLRSLDPKPGSQVSSQAVEYVVPDAFAYRHNGHWDVRLGPGSMPRLGINRHYQSLIGSAGKSDASYLRGQLQEARWLIRSLETRAETLLKVARCIVRQQSGFLDHGAEAMRPLVLREVADEVGLHESTVSRVTTRKYLHTPRGTFEFKHFFSSSLSTTDGGTTSSTAIQAMLKRLIEAENPRQPLSDARLAAELKTAGIAVARRTVAKYREAMNIPSSNERQRVG